MKSAANIKEMNVKILKIKALLEELDNDPNLFPALSRNAKRALASIKMLELNISDVLEFDAVES